MLDLCESEDFEPEPKIWTTIPRNSSCLSCRVLRFVHIFEVISSNCFWHLCSFPRPLFVSLYASVLSSRTPRNGARFTGSEPDRHRSRRGAGDGHPFRAGSDVVEIQQISCQNQAAQSYKCLQYNLLYTVLM